MSFRRKFKEFGRNRDNFGKAAQIGYRGKTTYGTTFGGYVSFIVRIFLLSIAMAQIYACFFDVKHVENERYTELAVPNAITSNIPYE